MPDTPDAPTSDSSSEQDVDSAINVESNDQLETAKHDQNDSKSEYGPVVQAAIDKLTGVEKEKQEVEKAPESKEIKEPSKEKQPEQKDAKPKDDPLKDFNDVEKKQLSQKTQRRIQDLWKSAKERETEVATLKESAEYKNGAWLNNLINDNNLANEARLIADEQLVGAIRFQGTLNRVLSGEGTDSDKQQLSKFYNKLYSEGVQLGLLNKQDTAPAFDPTPFENTVNEALVKLNEDTDFVAFIKTIKNAVNGIRDSQKKESSKQTQVQQQLPQQPREDQPKPANDAEGLYYSRKLAKDAVFLGDEAKDVKALFARLEGMTIDAIRKEFPGTNPKQYYLSLSIPARYEMLKEQLDSIKAAREAEKKSTSVSTERPIRTTQAHQKSKPTNPLDVAVANLQNWDEFVANRH